MVSSEGQRSLPSSLVVTKIQFLAAVGLRLSVSKGFHLPLSALHSTALSFFGANRMSAAPSLSAEKALSRD